MRPLISIVLLVVVACLTGCENRSISTPEDGAEATTTIDDQSTATDVNSPAETAQPTEDEEPTPPIINNDRPSWTFKKILRDHEDWVRGVAFSPDGKLMASGSDDSSIHLWDTSTWERLRTIETDTNVRGVAFSSDGKNIVIAGFGSVYVINVESGETRQQLNFHVIYGFSFEPAHGLVAACTDAESKVWDTNTGESVASFGGHTELISAVALSKDRILASGSHDKKVILWSLESAEQLTAMEGQDGWISCLAFSPDGTKLASGGHNNSIVLWDVESRTELRRIKCSDTPKALAFTTDGKTLVEGGWDGNVYLWNVDSGENIATLEDAEGRISGVAISSDGTKIASTELGGTITVWEKE